MTILKFIKAQNAALYDKIMNEGYEINIAMSGITATLNGVEVYGGMLCEMIETTGLVDKYEAHAITADLLSRGRYVPHETFDNQIHVVLGDLIVENPNDINDYAGYSLDIPE